MLFLGDASVITGLIDEVAAYASAGFALAAAVLAAVIGLKWVKRFAGRAS